MKNEQADETRDPVRTTIVGGQPSPSTTAAQKTPEGFERLLSLAASDERFRKRLLANRDAAVRRARIKLTESEKTILRSIPAEQLTRIIAKATPQPLPRRGFLRVVFGGAWMWLAALLGGAALTTPGCSKSPEPPMPAPTGARPDMPPGPPTRGRSVVPPEHGKKGGETETQPNQPSRNAPTQGLRPDTPPIQENH